MSTQFILWTLIPRGLSDGGERLKFSIFVSPKLDPQADPQRLDTFPEFVVWPRLLNELIFGVEFSNGAQLEAVRDADSTQADADVWQELFPPETFVRASSQTNLHQRLIHTYHVRDTLGFLKETYTAIGLNNPDRLPGLPILGNPAADSTLSRFIDLLGPPRGVIAEKMEKKARLAHNDAIRAAMKQGKVNALAPDLSAGEIAALGFNSRQEFDFYLAQRFYQRPETEPQPSDYLEKPDITKLPPPIKMPDIDFHQMLTLLTDHFALLRRFGIVIDIVTKRPDHLPASGWARLLVEQPATIGKGTPRTQYQIDELRFLPAPQSSGPTSDMRNGMLKLRQVSDALVGGNNEQLFDLLLVDADGAALKANNFALSSARLGGLDAFSAPHQIPYDTPQDAGLPALQTHGIGVARRGRAFSTAQRLQSMAANNGNPADPNALLFADDLLRGYRPDVLDTSAGDWRSLTARIGAYHFLNSGRHEEIAEEGYVKAASTTSADDQNSDLYLHEVLFKWAGWSLAAPRPGKAIRPHSSGLQQAEVPEDVPNTAATDFKLETRMRAQPGTLPRLRFGRAYRLRARVVDLAGNSVADKAVDDAESSAAVMFSRYEPVTPPAILLRDRVTEGESVEHMVIRSNYDQSAAAYVVGPRVVAALQGKAHTYTADSARHVAPPKTSQIMAEMHGMFDAAIGAGTSSTQRATAYAFAAREAGTYFDIAQAQLITPPELQGQPGVINALPPAPPSLSNPAGEQLAAGQYVIYPNNQTLPLPYLPDVFARGVALRFVPGVGAPLALGPGADALQLPDGSFAARIAFEVDWPDARPLRLRIMERDGMVDEASCQESFSAASEPIWSANERLLTVFLPKAAVVKLRYSCFFGQKELEQMGIWRWLAESATPAQLKTLAGFAEGGALWMLTPYRELTLVHAVQQPLCAPRFLRLGPRRQLGDTFTRFTGALRLSAKSTDKIDVMARWKEPVDNLADPGPTVVDGAARAFEMKIDAQAPDDQNLPRVSEKHEFGDTKHRLVEYHIVGTTRFREYFPPEITADPANITRVGEPWQPVTKTDEQGTLIEAGMHVPSSARPAAPKLVYVLPTFKWNRAWNARTFSSMRVGGGLRVYLERTWYSSGADELLGVLLPGNNPITDDALKPYVTRWGKDPITDSGRIDLSPLPYDFLSDGIETGTGLRLAELPRDVTAMGHPVYYDQTRQLWYADVVLDPRKMYWPFVRLALARYQPYSLNTAHLSRVVLADFAQLPPTRSLTVDVGKDLRTLKVTISGIAPTETSTSRAIKSDPQPRRAKPLPTDPQEGLNQFVVGVERRDTSIADADLGWDAEPLASIAKSAAKGIGAVTGVTNVLNFGIIGGLITPFVRLWSGTVVLPEPITQKRYRLVVRELETHYADAFGQWLNKKVDRSRLVYAETLELGPELNLD